MDPRKIFGNKTLNFAHRGFTERAVENTLSAFQAALELGVDGIELDVRTCKTGEVVVIHDPTVTRLTNGRGFVKSKTLSELKALRIKGVDGEFDEQIPTLAEVLDLVGEKTILNVEIKTKGLPKDHIEQKVVDVLRAYALEYKSIISSFNPLVLRRIKKIDEKIMSGYLIDKNFNVRNSEISLSKLAGARAIHLEWRLATENLIQKIKDSGYYLMVWSVNEPKMMQRYLQLGVHGIITDRSDLLNEYLRGER
ncbi:MAG: glycerophosphodiester phosphodiesterase [bacterium]